MAATIQMRIRIFHGAERALGPGRAELLGRVEETHSIAQAARDMGMSYMKAWKLIQSMNRCFAEAAVEVHRGGKGGGAARLTPTGTRALKLYRAMEKESNTATEPLVAELARLFAGGSSL
jgi:molybdate transport system regulatory protein